MCQSAVLCIIDMSALRPYKRHCDQYDQQSAKKETKQNEVNTMLYNRGSVSPYEIIKKLKAIFRKTRMRY